MKATVNNNNIESKNRVNNSRKQTKVAAAKLVGKTIHWSDRRKDGKPDALHEYSVKAVGECGSHTICLQTIKDGRQEHDLWLGFDVVETLTSGKAVEINTQHVQRSIRIESNKNQLDGPKGKVNGFQIGDKVKHNWFDDVATITAKRQAHTMGETRWLYTLDFGHTVTGPFGTDYNGEEFMAEALTLCEPTGKPKPVEIVAPVTEADKSASWETSYTADDFQKLTTAGEVNEEDRDIIGRRFCHAIGNDGDMLEVFVGDYAGNERHALVYTLDPLFEDVRCKVRSLDFLRKFYTEARGWQAA